MQDDDPEIERMLLRYRPRGPSPALRERVLNAAMSAEAAVSRPAIRFNAAWVFRAPIAAILLLALGLNHFAQSMNRDTAERVGVGPVVWSADAEDAAQLIGGDSGREYIALCLIASNEHDARSNLRPSSPGGLQ